MRLRHKKPLNPYKGQTNNDKNEFNDDDFGQQGSPHKKAANGSTDQIYKYARILAKFIKTINQDYNAYQLQQHHQMPPPPTNHPNDPTPVQEEKLTFSNSLRCQQIKQQKQITKIQSKKQAKEDNRDGKAQSKKKEPSQSHGPLKQNKNKGIEHSFSNSVDVPKNTTLGKSLSQGFTKNEKEIGRQKQENLPKNNINFPSHLSSNPTPNPHSKINSNIPSNLPTNMGMPNMMGLQGIFPSNQVINFQMLGRINQIQLLQKMYQGYPQGYIPLNLLNLPMMNMVNPNPLIFQPPKIPYQNLFNELAKNYNSKGTPHTSKNIKQVYPLKRSAFHVAIAYKIYLDKLKKQGHSFQKLQDIDPTRQARFVKTGQNQNGKSKQGNKKKK